MLLDKILLSDDTKTSIAEHGFLQITKRTVKLENDVYQFCNVTGFGVGEIKTRGIPGIAIFVMFITGVILVNIYPYESWGILLSVLCFIAIFYNTYRPKVYGLFLYLNSGQQKIFITQDLAFLRVAVKTLKEFMESPQNDKIVSIAIGRDVKGNITIGNINGDVLNM